MGLALPYQLLASGRTVLTGVPAAPVADAFFPAGASGFNRVGPGVYRYTLSQPADAVAPGTTQFACCEPSAGAARQATVTRPDDNTVQIETFDAAGAPADAAFSWQVFLQPTTNI